MPENKEPKTSTALREAIKKYNREKTVTIPIRLHKENDKEIIDWLNMMPSKAGYIKQLIKDDIDKGGKV